MAKKQALILITNDDGISAPGISALVKVAKEITNNIVVVAPDKPQSGMGHAITMNSMLRYEATEVEGVKAYACSGTPVDSVKMGISKILKKKPDLILSGINHGSNSSINVIYSGTMSAAVEGAIEGVPSIGFSLCDGRIDANFEPCLPYVKSIIEHGLGNKISDGACLNVNIPAVERNLINGIKVCRQAEAVWKERFEERKDPSGKDYFWLTGEFLVTDQNPEDTDEFALQNNYISVVPVQFDVTAYKEMKSLKKLQNVKKMG